MVLENHPEKNKEHSKGNSKKTWEVIKEVTGKKQLHKSTILNRIKLNSNREIFDKKEIAENFNKFFINIGKELAADITPGNNFKKTHYVMDESELSLNELQASFNALKINKSAGFDDINVNVLKAVFDAIKLPVLFIFNLSITTGIFPCQLKIARVVPVYKNGDDSIPSNYRPISILSCFSKLLERIIVILKNIISYSANSLVSGKGIQHIMQ
nr:uncharacterized protein LOC124819085 [Hydra vulgaris]